MKKSAAQKNEFIRLLSDPFQKDKTNLERMREIGISNGTFYNWMKDEKIMSEVKANIDAYTDSELAPVWGALIEECKKGNVAAIKLYMELKEKYRAKLELIGDNTININIKVDD